MIHIVKGPEAIHHPLKLPELSYVSPGIEWPTYVDGDGESDLIWLMRDVAGNYVVPPNPKIGDQPCSDGAQASSY
jgi:hypothetical protein